MRIDILTIDGSPSGVTPPEIERPGVGGSELALMQWARVMARRGHEVSIFNNPRNPGVYENVSFKHAGEFKPQEYRDVLLTFRGPKVEETRGARYGIAVGWTTDQFEKSYQEPWYATTDGLVGISEFHRTDHKARCGLLEDRMRVIDIGCDEADFPVVPKVPYQFMYNSMPNRGLVYLTGLWPLIRDRYPKARLIVTSDFSLWDNGRGGGGEEYRALFRGMPGVEFRGAVARRELLRLEGESEIHFYPCAFEELFCISNAEMQMAGAYAVTSSSGALKTTNCTGYVSSYRPGTQAFRDDALRAIDLLYQESTERRAEKVRSIRDAARTRFDWNRIAHEWEEYFKELLEKKNR